MNKYWNKGIVDGWLYITCPVMEDAKAMKLFSMKRKVYEELKDIEKELKNSELKGWIAYTGVKNTNMLSILLDQGAVPYKINKEESVIWVKKEKS